MAENETNPSEARIEAELEAAPEHHSRPLAWLDLLKALAIPTVTLILGFVFNSSLNTRQTRENNIRLYTEMMGRREESDSALRKDMFNSILGTFMSKDSKLKPDEKLDQDVLNLELLAYNFHESLDLGPLFKHLRRRIPDQQEGRYADMRSRLEKVAQEVIGRQLTVLSDSGMVDRGDVSLEKVNDLQAYIVFDSHVVPDPKVNPGEGVSRVCLFMNSTDEKPHYRQFKLEIIKYDPLTREVQVRLYVSKILEPPADCQRADLDEVENREIDTTFWVGLFDFPMIDNTHLTHGERCAVSLTQMSPYSAIVALAYFPGSRASLKDKPYYDDVMHDLVRDQHLSGHDEP
jgi:hypothetical protein